MKSNRNNYRKLEYRQPRDWVAILILVVYMVLLFVLMIMVVRGW